jgi:hypothetical protein
MRQPAVRDKIAHRRKICGLFSALFRSSRPLRPSTPGRPLRPPRRSPSAAGSAAQNAREIRSEFTVHAKMISPVGLGRTSISAAARPAELTHSVFAPDRTPSCASPPPPAPSGLVPRGTTPSVSPPSQGGELVAGDHVTGEAPARTSRACLASTPRSPAGSASGPLKAAAIGALHSIVSASIPSNQLDQRRDFPQTFPPLRTGILPALMTSRFFGAAATAPVFSRRNCLIICVVL